LKKRWFCSHVVVVGVAAAAFIEDISDVVCANVDSEFAPVVVRYCCCFVYVDDDVVEDKFEVAVAAVVRVIFDDVVEAAVVIYLFIKWDIVIEAVLDVFCCYLPSFFIV